MAIPSAKAPPPKRFRRLPRLEREQQLLDVAEELFMERGYDRTTIEDIARQAGVTRPVVYEHHGPKECVYLACVARARAQFDDEVRAAVVGIDDARERLRVIGDVFYSILERDRDRWVVLFGGSAVPVIGELGDRLTELRFVTVRMILENIRCSVTESVDEERLEAAAHSISGVGEQLGRWWIKNPDIPRARIVDYYTSFSWVGIAPIVESEL